ncbi:MAG: HAD family hydrolase [Chloroflexota bacterium]
MASADLAAMGNPATAGASTAGGGPLAGRAIIFDLFGTLLYDFPPVSHRAVIGQIAGLLGAPFEAFFAGWQATYDDRATGRLATIEANLRHVLAGLGLSAPAELLERATALRMDFRARNLRVREGAVEVLTELRRRGYQLGLLSDCSMEVPLLWQTTPLPPLLDAAVFSCEAGMRKPAPAMYEMIRGKLGVRAVDCLYVGDGGSRELTGAQTAGMRPVWIPTCGEDARVDPEVWPGEAIATLSELLHLVQ